MSTNRMAERLFIIRHGKSELRGEEELRGLEPEGMRAAGAIAACLGSIAPTIDAVYSSPYQRALLTMKPLADLRGLDVTVLDLLSEKKLSAEPVPDKAIEHQKMWLDFSYKLPGGESSRDAQDRVLDAIKQIRTAHPEGCIAIGSHGTLIALLLNAYSPAIGYADWVKMAMPAIFQLDYSVSETPKVQELPCPGVDAFRIDG
jgi:broad specificity phosphatase PhoE